MERLSDIDYLLDASGRKQVLNKKLFEE
jgi:hypothetical protein